MRPLDPLKARKPLAGTAAPRAVGPDAFASRLDEVEKALERARALHESYFLGLEKRAPESERVDLQRRLNELRKLGTSNTALRFRLETLVQRHIVLSTYWNRTLREIESGTYRRDVFKAQRHQAERAARAASTAVDPKPPAAPPAAAPVPTTAPPASHLHVRPAAAPAPAPAPAAASPNRAPPPAAPPRAVPPPIPTAALKRAAAAAIMSKPAPPVPAPAPPPPAPSKR